MGDAVIVLTGTTIFGNKKIAFGTISGAASYATSGDAIVSGWDGAFGFKVEQVIIGAGAVNYLADISGNLLLAYLAGTAASEFDEVTSTDDMSGNVAPFIAIGTVS